MRLVPTVGKVILPIIAGLSSAVLAKLPLTVGGNSSNRGKKPYNPNRSGSGNQKGKWKGTQNRKGKGKATMVDGIANMVEMDIDEHIAHVTGMEVDEYEIQEHVDFDSTPLHAAWAEEGYDDLPIAGPSNSFRAGSLPANL